MTTKLSLKTLPSIGRHVEGPAYERQDLKPGILHFGIGNFHRAHQAIYLHELFNTNLGLDWAIVGAGVRPSDAAMRKALKDQDYLTTVVERDAAGQTARITGVLIDYVEPGDIETLMVWMTNPDIRIVSLTITEGGYYLDSAGHFNAAHPEIAADIASPDNPKTVFGLITAGLKARRAAGLQPFTIMCCDNLPENGHVTRNAVVGFAEKVDPELARWIDTAVAFPNAMVDRITPATSDAERALVRDEYDIEDNWPVTCETFIQWVIEDHFPAGRPALEKVGVTFVPDVAPYEIMKIRILNGGHAAIAYPAGLLDIHFVHEAMQDGLIASFLRHLEENEIVPIVPPVPDTSLTTYLDKIVERFANPTVGDTIRRLCLDGSNRQPKFILPSVRDRLKANASITGLALVSALWCRYCEGTTESGAEIAPNDPQWERLQKQALASRQDPKLFLEMQDVFGDLANTDAYVHAFTQALNAVRTNGTRNTLERYIAGDL